MKPFAYKPVNASKLILSAALLCAVTATTGCGPVYTEDRWYARDYYAPRPAGPAPVAYAEPPVAPDPQFTDLSAYGQWIMTEEYGRIWVPYANRTPGWRPYFYGQWEYTDWGWSWVSDEVWGAGPYHYGRWTWMSGHNWVWIPDYTWGPAWVTWSAGGGCVGWAPMGPGGATWGDIHAHYTYWTYVPTAQFGGVKVQHVVVAAADVPAIHRQTVIVDNTSQIRGNNGSVVTYHPGPPRDQVQQWTSRPVPSRPIDQVPSVQPRRIPDTATSPTGGTYGTATAPPTRPGTPAVTPNGVPTHPGTGYTGPGPVSPATGTPVPTRPGVGTVVQPTSPGYTPPTYTPPTRPSAGTVPTSPGYTPPTYTPPTRPSAGTVPTSPGYTPPTYAPPTAAPPTRPGTGGSPDYTPPTYAPPTRPGTGYTGTGPVNLPGQTTPPRPTPPPVDRGNYAPPPARYVPPSYSPPSYSPPPSYQPSRPSPGYAPPSYSPPSYQPSRPSPGYSPPAYQPSRPSPGYSPPPQRFSPPPAFSPSPSRPSPGPSPAPTRRR